MKSPISTLRRTCIVIPSVKSCFALMDRLGMPEHIRRHSIMVEQAAAVIAEAHVRSGAPLFEEMVRAGALLHDIAKAPCLETGEDHAAKGREICLSYHFTEISDIVGEHVKLRRFDPDGKVLEKEIVYYADKRVNHDRIVSLEERLSDLIERYSRGSDELALRIRSNFAVCRDVERKLFHNLTFRPEDLSRLVEQAEAPARLEGRGAIGAGPKGDVP
ncbi:MAG: HDIG domain-containing protein [Desulfobacteraceae bacterium]|jgi:uncharacterized protein